VEGIDVAVWVAVEEGRAVIVSVAVLVRLDVAVRVGVASTPP
jgi:hypothetical protein